MPPQSGPPVTVVGTLDLEFINATGTALAELYLRLYPNDERYTDGGIELEEVTVDGTAVEPELSVGETVARLALAEPLPDGGSVDVSLGFTTTMVQSFDFFSTMFNYVPETGTISLAHWYPILAGYDPATGWLLAPISLNGDLVFSNTALYDVALTAPADIVVTASGNQVAEDVMGETTRRQFVTGPAREFSVMIDNDFGSMRREVGDTTVTAWYNPEHGIGAAAVLDAGVQALTLFNELFGTYPYEELDIVESQMFGAGGIEYPQLIGIDMSLWEDPAIQAEQGFPPGLAEYIVAHEVAHQWWYGLVGNNHYAHAFIDEGMAEASTIVYFERIRGEAAADLHRIVNLSNSYAFQYALGGDSVVNQPTDAFGDPGAYFASVYSKAGLGFDALRVEIGDDAFFAGLSDYTATHRFDVAAPDDLRAAFEEASGEDLAAFWRGWFETAGDRITVTVEIDVAATGTPAAATPDATPTG
jgi:hypothetical protein